MKKCKYHCDYGDGEYCHYEGDGCANHYTGDTLKIETKEDGELMTELKPCPFCGESGEEIEDYTYHIPGNIYIGIFYCRICGGAMIDTNKSHSWYDRAKLWNKRFNAD